MHRRLRKIFVSLFILNPFVLLAQKDQTITHDMGFSIQVPARMKVEMAEEWVNFEGFVGDQNYYLRGSVGFEKKADFKRFSYGYHLRKGWEYQRVGPGQNEQLAARKGMPAVYLLEPAESHRYINLWADFDAERLVYLKFSSSELESWEEIERLIWKMIRTFQIRDEQTYEIAWEDENLLDPLPFDGSALAPVEGPLGGQAPYFGSVEHFAFDLPSYYDWETLDLTGPSAAALPDGGFVFAWIDSLDNTHLIRFDKRIKRVGEEVVLKGLRCEALVGDNQGFAGFFVRGVGDWHQDYHHGYLIGFDKNGKQRFKTEVAGTRTPEVENEQWIHIGINQCDLAFSGEAYGVYISTNKNWGVRGVHQGDLLRFYDESGKMVMRDWFGKPYPLGWDWGVSHSFSKAICWDGEAFTMAAIGDGHPRGIAFSRVATEPKGMDFLKASQENIREIPGKSGDNDAKHNIIGGIQAEGAFAQLLLTSPLQMETAEKAEGEAPQLYSGFIHGAGSARSMGKVGRTTGMTDVNPKIIRLGDYNLLLWSEMESTGLYQWSTFRDYYAIYSPKGKRISGPYELPTWFALEIPKTSHYLGYAGNRYNGAKPIVLKNGDVIWIRLLLVGDRIEVIRFRMK